MDNAENTTRGPGEVKGLVLRVDGWADQQPVILRFYKDRSQTINIGRKSGQNPGKYVSTEDRALFQCPVVSRQHAKLTFTEQGDVTLTDLGSHHGTHLRKSGEVTSMALSTEVPQVLTEGDTITFGKRVTREDSDVQPIIAHLQLEYAIPSAPLSQTIESSEQRSSSRPTSGRYGVYVTSDASSSSDESDNDSVVFLHSSPPTRDSNCLPSFQSLRSANFSLDSIRSNPNNPFRGALPRIHTLSSAPSSRSSSVMEISPTDEAPPSETPLPATRLLEGLLEAIRNESAAQSEPQVIGAWPKSPIDLRSISPPPFPRGSVGDSSASSEDGAVSHASSDDDVDEEQRENNTHEDDTPEEAVVPEDKPAETTGSDENPPSLPDAQEVELVKDNTEESVQNEPQSNDVQMSDISDAATEEVPAVQDIIVDEVSVEEQAPISREVLPEKPKSDDDVESLKASVAAIAELRRKAEEDLAAIKAAHAEYEQTLAKMKAIPPNFNSTSSSPLKRKRTIEFDEADVCTLGVGPGCSEIDLELPPLVHAEVGRLVRFQAPAAKRRRVARFMTAVAQTTAIATVGAVAAWSALAFA